MNPPTTATWLQLLKNKDTRALSRLISMAENEDTEVYSVLRDGYGSLGKSKVIGITGPPGAGKSTLTGSLIRLIREKKMSVAVVAVDPASPFSGGSLLGDRIRLADHFNDPSVYIRSLSTRGKLGGLSRATRQVVHLVDLYGFDYTILESVGVGQSEIDIRGIADVALLAVVPEWGDSIQTLKAGIVEIADLFVVNKCDRDGAEKLVQDLKFAVGMSGKAEDLVLSASSFKEETVRSLFQTIDRKLQEALASGLPKRRLSASTTAKELLLSVAMSEIENWAEKNAGTVANPYAFIVEFRKRFPQGILQLK